MVVTGFCNEHSFLTEDESSNNLRAISVKADIQVIEMIQI